MTADWIEYIPWAYASIQAIITLIISIIGAKYVRSEFLMQRERMIQQQELQTLSVQQPTAVDKDEQGESCAPQPVIDQINGDKQNMESETKPGIEAQQSIQRDQLNHENEVTEELENAKEKNNEIPQQSPDKEHQLEATPSDSALATTQTNDDSNNQETGVKIEIKHQFNALK